MKANPQLFLDTLLMEVRRVTISFSIKTKKEKQAQEQLLMHDIEALETELVTSNDQTFIEINQQLQVKRQELEAIYTHQAYGAYVRARAKYKVEGEKPTKLFCSLEKHNSVQKYIPKLVIDKNGTSVTITDQKSIESRARIITYKILLLRHFWVTTPPTPVPNLTSLRKIIWKGFSL